MASLSNTQLLSKYLQKHDVYNIEVPVAQDVSIIAVIPVYRERDYLFSTINSLLLCNKPNCAVEVILVFNCSELDNDDVVSEQQCCANDIRAEFINKTPDWFTLIVVESYGLRKKHFGAGMARKIGMDLAAKRFLEANNPQGVIVALDADSVVEANYFEEVNSFFRKAETNGANIYFEHSLAGEKYPSQVYEGILHYELHLRYYLQAHRYAGFPFSFHSMGSAMAARASVYARIGGMPRKQAGEDFYFLQKVIPLGNFGEINTTTVRPSPRPSSRVIFGTGAAITSHLQGTSKVELTYNLQSFHDLKQFLDIKSELFTVVAAGYESWSYKLSGPMRSFLLNSGFFSDIDILKNDCANQSGFDKRFFEVFNAFKIVKYLNYVAEHFYDKTSVFDASLLLLDKLNINSDNLFTETDVLLFYRSLERNNPFYL